MYLLASFLPLIILLFVLSQAKQSSPEMEKCLKQIVKCKCGKVELAIDSPSSLRIVCYSKDYRGYYNTLNERAKSKGNDPNAALNEWGGVDLTQIYPSEITVNNGKGQMAASLIREGSPIRRVHSTCCDTPLFDIGGAAAMLNTDLVDKENKAEIWAHIIGRQALRSKNKPPNMSWSVPFGWFWTMPCRIRKEKMEPSPIDLSAPQVMKDFQTG